MSQRTPRRTWLLVLVLAALAAPMVAPAPAEAQTFSYAVKFVCGYNRTNLGLLADGSGDVGGENVVKIGNYATDVNIFNPGADAKIKKKALLLVDNGKPVGREPKIVLPNPDIPPVELEMPNCSATYDDCNEILRLAGVPVAPGLVPGLYVGFLVITSETEIDVTAVYTAELCSDVTSPGVGATGMCQSLPGQPGFAAFGTALSIDVEQIEPTRVNP